MSTNLLVVVPRRYALDPEKWQIEERSDNKYPVDAMSIDFPRKGKRSDDGFHGIEWREYRDKNIDIELLETPSLQGSCWMMTKDCFDNFFKGLHEEGYGKFAQEAQEIGMKIWLGGGKLITNKKTYYSHLHKGSRYGRFYKMPGGVVEADSWSASHWLNNEEPNMIHTFAWFINEKFPLMPGWPKDWERQVKEMGWIKP